MPTVLYSLSILPSFSFLFFFIFLLSVYLFCCDSLLEVAITVFVIVILTMIPFLLCMARPLFIVPAVIGFYYFSL